MEFSEEEMFCFSHVDTTQTELLNLISFNGQCKELVQMNLSQRSKTFFGDDDIPPYRPLVVMGPQSVGKTSLIDHVLAKYPRDFCIVRQHTTKTDVDSEKYISVTKNQF